MPPVGGLVSLGGKPVGGGQIMFVPAKPGPTATGLIGRDGRYTLSTFSRGDGAPLGDHEVLIESVPDTSTTMPEDVIETRTPATPPEIPQKFGRPGRSGLAATVTSGSNAVDFRLE